MKTLLKLTFLVSFFCAANTYSQKGINVGVAPLGVLSKIAISAEFETPKAWSFGTTVSYNYGTVWVGTKGEANLRYYFAQAKDSSGTDGFYGVVQAGIASFKTPYSVTSSEYKDNPFLSPTLNLLVSSINGFAYLDGQKTSANGISIGIGYKKSIKRFYIDFNCRYQKWKTTSKSKIIEKVGNETITYTPYDGDDRGSFYLYGPGSIIAPTFILGYKIEKR